MGTIDPIVIIGGAGIAAAYALTTRSGGGALLAPSPQPLPAAGSASPIAVRDKLAKIGGRLSTGGTVSALIAPAGDIGVRQQLKELEEDAKNAYNALEGEAKKRAAAELNKMNPSPGLTGEETWEEASAKVGASIGAIVGVAGCNAIPIPGAATVLAHTVCATLGAMIGAYLGENLGEWAKKAYAEVKAAADKAWESVKDAAEDAYEWVKFW